MLSILLSAALLAGPASALAIRSRATPSVRGTPILGFNTYNDVACSPNASYVETTLQALKDKGFVDLGYNMFQIDCGWQAYERQANGSLTYDATVFPDGILPLSQKANSLGFDWGMYTDEGVYACDTSERHRPGSLGYEREDALMFAAWNAVYMKVDNCWVDPDQNAPKDPRSDFVSRYSAMWNNLTEVGIDQMLICQWGTPYIAPDGSLEDPAKWTPPISTSFRTSDDIASGWHNVWRILNQNIYIDLNGLSGPGNFGDLDLLEVGNPGMTLTEQASHFAIWSAFKSALMISTDIPNMSSVTFNILSNKDIIAINQDSLGEPVKLIQRFTLDHDLYIGDLENNDKVILLLDTSNSTNTLSVDLTEHGIASADILDLWSGATSSGSSYSATVAAHGTVFLRLSNIKPQWTSSPSLTFYDASEGSYTGNARTLPCAGCDSGSKAGYISVNSSLTLSGIKTSQAEQDVRFDYINCDIGYTFADPGPNVRGANISVNGGAAQQVYFPITGYDWTQDLLKNFLVRLSGFNTEGENTITITGDQDQGGYGLNGYAPDFSRIGVVS